MIKNIFTQICILLSIFSCIFFINPVNAGSDFWKPDFTIDVKKITPMWKDNIPGATLQEKTDNFLIDVIEILMVSIWVISLFVVSIWAGYMIFYNWKEDFLTKWRNMIFTWFLALFIALTSYYLINLVRYILYGK